MPRRLAPFISGLLVLALGPATLAQSTRTWEQTDPRYGFLTPIPDHGAIAPILGVTREPTAEQIAFNKRAREYAAQIRLLRHNHFGTIRAEAIRARGLAELRRFTDPAAFVPLIEALSREADDVRLEVLDHLTGQGDEGQAALAWVAIHDTDDRIRDEAMGRLVAPASGPVLRVLDAALRSNTHRIGNNAGTVAGAVHALETIPLLIFAQATADPVQQEGDLAWIAVATQTAFVAGIEPVVGSGAAAFRLIPGVVQEGTILRVVDAVAIFYRTEIHRSLVAMTTHDWGQSTAHLGYDMKAWWAWYNDEYVVFKNRQVREARLAGQRQSSSSGD